MRITNRFYYSYLLPKILRSLTPNSRGGEKYKNKFLICFILLSLGHISAKNPINNIDNALKHLSAKKPLLTSFTFDCTAPTVTGAFYSSGVTQTGFITLKISSVVSGATSIVVTNANGFSGGIASTTLSATQTSVQIPISFTGLTPVGSYVLNISSPHASNSCSVTVNVAACSSYKPVISTNVPSILCTGDSITMTASTGIRYTWSTGETTASVMKKIAGNYSVTVTSNGCTGSNSQTVSYNTNCESGLCSGVLASNSYNITFGTGGRTNLASAVVGATTTHIYSPTGAIIDGQYAVANNATEAGGWAANTSDHSGDGATGRLMVINADNTPKECFRLPVSGLCSNLKYQFSAWIRNISNKPEKPNVTLEVRDAVTDSLFAIKGTGDIPYGGWIQYGLTFNTPANPNLIVVLRNNTKGGLNGNDLVIDDIQFAYCGPPVVSTMQGGSFDATTGEGSACKGKLVTLKTDVTPGYLKIPEYQWQESIDNGATWRNISGATTLNYSFTSDSTFNGRRYKLLVAETGKITTPRCRVESNTLIFKYPTGIGNINVIGSTSMCAGDSVTLIATNGATYSWSSGEKTAEITKNAAGTYTVTITDTGGCLSNATKTVIVNTRPTATITTVGESNINSGGSATLTASGGVSYAWASGDKTASITVNVAGTYTVTVTNANGCTAIATKTIGPNTPPTASNSTPNVTGNTIYSGSVTSNASDPEGSLNPNGFAITDNPRHGTINMNPNGTYTYTPTSNFSGVDSVHFKACDLGGLCATATIIFNVTIAPNSPPVVTNATPTAQEDVPLNGNVAPNATDADNNLNPNGFSVTDSPQNGTISMNPNGTFIYTPKPNFNGIDSVHYKACDVKGACTTATLIITVNPVNDPPTLTNSTPSVQEDIPFSGNVAPNANDIDPNLDNSSFTIVDAPLNGTISMNPNGAYTYTPKPNFNGVDSVHFKVCDFSGACATATLIFTVSNVNDAPTLTNATPTLQEDTPLIGSVQPNASDSDNNLNPNSFVILDSPKNGTMNMNPNGTFTYIPNPNFNGKDSVHYKVCDVTGACASATIILTVNAVNDAPTLSNASPAAQEDAPTTGNVAPNAADADGNLNPNSFAVTDSPKNGVINMNPNGTFTYTPKPNFSGIDSVHYKVCDSTNTCTTATLTFNVSPVNDAPFLTNSTPTLLEDSPLTASVLLNAIDVDGNLNPNSFVVTDNPLNGTITMNPNGSYTYTPKPNFNGVDSVHYRVCDLSGACSSATLVFTIIPTNDAPTLLNATPALDEDLPFTASVLPNASDIDNNLNPNSFAVLNSPLHGTIVMNANGTYTYTPTLDYSGQDSVRYQVCDFSGVCTTASIIFNVSSVNDAPTLSNATPSVNEDVVLTGNVAPNAKDIDNNLNPNSFVIIDNPVNGTITMQPNGAYTYTPKPNFNGIDSVHYRVCDSTKACTAASIIINVNPVNDAPTLTTATPSVQEDVPQSGTVLPNSFDPDGNLNPNSFILMDSPKNGTITMNASGTYLYTPNPNFNGKDSVHYQVCDFTGSCTQSTIIFTVNPVNDAPVVTNTTPSVNEDFAYNGSVSPNVTDADNNLNNNSFIVLDSPVNGTIQMSPNGNYIYTPRPNFNGVDSIHYQVCDLSGACGTATIIITVKPVNDAPKFNITAPQVMEDSPVTFCGIVNDNDLGDVFNTRLCNQPKGLFTPSFNNNQLCIEYTPSKDYNGLDTICMLVCDRGGLCDTVKIPLNIIPINDAPTLIVNPINVPADSTIIQCFLISDPDLGETFSASFCDIPKGNAKIKVENGNVCINYSTKFPNFENDAICVVLCDKAGACSQAYIPVTITLCDDKTPPNLTCPENVEVSSAGTVLSDRSKFILQSSLADNCNGVHVGFNIPTATDDCSIPVVHQIEGIKSGGIFPKGLNILTFEALDNNGKKSNCKVEINVVPVQLLTVDATSACINETLNFQGKALSEVVYTWKGPENLNATGSTLMVPINNINQKGLYILTAIFKNSCYIKDTITVNVNNAPKILNDSFILAMDATLTENILKNDVLLNGINFTVRVRDNPLNGTLNLKKDGTITYQPLTGYKGTDNFSYEVCTDICPNICQKGNVILNVSDAFTKEYKANEVITPNNDGFNDALIIEDFDAASSNNKSTIVIYSQWGELVYQAAPYKNDWSGTFKELPLPDGTYYFIFKATPTSQATKSFITILR
jgi:large repetitive protein